MIYAYLSVYENNHEELRLEIEQYADSNGFKIDNVFLEEKHDKSHWKDRLIGQVIDACEEGDHIIVFNATNLARSSIQVTHMMQEMVGKGVSLHFVKYGEIFKAQKNLQTRQLINLMQNVVSDYISKRTSLALKKRRAAGLPLGRPVGSKNRVFKLDFHKSDIERYLDLGVSKASIARLVGCHPQTLYAYIKKHSLI